MDLSIIIPCHNLEGYIEKCIDSILAQDITGYSCEIIFVCDSCTDDTKRVIRKTFEKNNSFHIMSIYSCDYKNPGATRNLGLKIAKGSHIWFIDGDDWLLDNNIIKEAFAQFSTQDIDIFKFDYHTKLVKTNDAVWRYIFKTPILEGIWFNDKEIFEDKDFMEEVFAKNPKIFTTDKVYYHYNHPREGSIVATYLKKSNLHGIPPWKR